jgi:hypothetical protein
MRTPRWERNLVSVLGCVAIMVLPLSSDLALKASSRPVLEAAPNPIPACMAAFEKTMRETKGEFWCTAITRGAPRIWVHQPESLVPKAVTIGCPTCDVDLMTAFRPLQAFDYESLQDLVVKRIRSSGERVAFLGFSSGELVVTTVPKSQGRPSDNAYTYYQAIFATRLCPDFSGGSMPCGIYGATDKLRFVKGSIPVASRDELCQKMEDEVVKYIRSLYRREG